MHAPPGLPSLHAAEATGGEPLLHSAGGDSDAVADGAPESSGPSLPLTYPSTSKRAPFFLLAIQGGKQASSFSRQGTGFKFAKLGQAQIPDWLEFDSNKVVILLRASARKLHYFSYVYEK